jgi:hypothetical protein
MAGHAHWRILARLELKFIEERELESVFRAVKPLEERRENEQEA